MFVVMFNPPSYIHTTPCLNCPLKQDNWAHNAVYCVIPKTGWLWALQSTCVPLSFCPSEKICWLVVCEEEREREREREEHVGISSVCWFQPSQGSRYHQSARVFDNKILQNIKATPDSCWKKQQNTVLKNIFPFPPALNKRSSRPSLSTSQTEAV